MYPSFTFIRHGESTHNQKTSQLSQKLPPNQVPTLKSTPEYKAIKYNPQLRDGNITKLGQNQAKKVRQLINVKDFDVVVVSPMRRALETCRIVFGDVDGVKIYVEPLISQRLSSAVDIGDKIGESRGIYGGKFDFQRIPVQGEDKWYLRTLINQENQKLILQKAQKDNISISQATLQILKTTDLETFQQLKNRVKALKQQLIKYKQLSKKKVALIGHSEIFTSLTATGYYPDGTAVNGVKFGNCQPREIPIIIEGYQEEDEEVQAFCGVK